MGYRSFSYVALGEGDFTFSEPESTLISNVRLDSLLYLCPIDYNRDGNKDIVIMNKEDSVYYLALLTGNGDGTFQSPATMMSLISGGYLNDYKKIYPFDFDEDSYEDIVLIRGYDMFVAVSFIPGELQFESTEYSVLEEDGSIDIVVERIGSGSDGTVTVDYAVTGGTAVNGDDYTLADGTLTFIEGDTEETITIPLIDDTAAEYDTIELSLSNPTNNATLRANSTTTIIINDGDTDDILPEWPIDAVLTAVPSDDSVELLWPEASDDNLIKEYQIYQGISQIHTVLADVRAYTVTDLSYETPYEFSVIAVDRADNESASLEKTVSTLAEIDNNPPVWDADAALVVNSVTYDTERTTAAITLSWAPAQDPSGTKYYAEIYTSGYSFYEYVYTNDTTYTFNDLPYDYYYIDVYCSDLLNHWATEYLSAEINIDPDSTDNSGSGGSNRGGSSESAKDGDLDIIITEKSDRIIAKLSSDAYDNVLDRVVTDKEGNRWLYFDISKKGTDNYEINLPLNALESEGNPDLEFKTDIGSIQFPGNMLENINGSEVTLAFNTVDPMTLSQKLRAEIGDKPVIELSIQVDGDTIQWNNPDSPVTVSIPYTPTAEELENPEHITVWYIDGEGNIVSVPNGRYDTETGFVSFSTTHFSIYAVAYVEKSFKDLGNF